VEEGRKTTKNSIRSMPRSEYDTVTCITAASTNSTKNFKDNTVTPGNKAFLDNPTVAQAVKKFPAFYDPRRLISVSTTARYWSLT
jgi:hypothetical protein